MRCSIDGQGDGKDTSFARLAADPDMPTVGRHQGLHDAQSEPGALANLFGREERVENARLLGFVHPLTKTAFPLDFKSVFC